MNARSKNKRRSHAARNRRSTLRGLESLENRYLMAGELLEVRLDAVTLDGVTPITQINDGQEFLLRGRARDLRTGGQGAFQVYTDINYLSSETVPVVGEVQRLDFLGDPQGGSFTLTYQGVTTAPINFSEFSQGIPQANAIQTALEGIPALAGNVRVDPDNSFNLSLPRFRYFIRFISQLDERDVTNLTVDASGLTTDPSDPGATAGAQVTEVGKGQRTDDAAFRHAFLYNPRVDSFNEASELYPDNRQAADETNLFDNVGGGANILEPPGTGFGNYFVLRARASDNNGDGRVTFVNGPSNEPGLEIFLFGNDNAVTSDQILFTYGGANPSANRLELVVNTAVRAVDDTGYAVREDIAAAVLSPSPLANDIQTPATPRTLRITGVSAGSDGGTLTIINSGADVRYVPAANFFGTETFTYTVEDADGNSSVGDITITVNPVNDAPSFTKGPNVTVNEDAPLQSIANWATAITAGPREGGQTLTFDVTTSNDALFQTLPAISDNGTLSFRPAANRSGSATVTVTLRDNGGTANGGVNVSPSQTFRIIVRSINDKPVNDVPGTQSVDGTSPLLFQGATALSFVDVDSGAGDLVTTLSVNNGRLQIGGTIDPGLVVTGNNTGTVTLTGTRAEINSALSLVTYRANTGFNGADTLTMVTNDQGNTGLGGAKSDTDTVQINVGAQSPPTAVADNASATEDGPAITIDVLDNDIPRTGEQPTLESASAVNGGTAVVDTKGTASKTDDEVRFTPAPNFNGQATITYVMNDTGAGGMDSTGTVTVNVAPVNDAPVARGNRYSMGEDKVLIRDAAGGVLVNDNDVDGDTLTAVFNRLPEHGTLNLNADGSFRYTPDANFNGQDTFTYRAKDPSGARSNAVTVTITVNAIADRPVALNKTYAATEGAILSVPAANGLLVGATDADGDTTLRTIRTTQAANGTVTVQADGSFTYRPAANFNGVDTFTYQVVDSTDRTSVPKTVTLNVAPTNDRPVARPDSYTTSEGTELAVAPDDGVLRNDSDIDGDPLTVVRGAAPQNGTLQLNSNGSFRYQPNPGFVGTDTFTYRARDNSGAANNTSALTTVTITVTETNDAPSAAPKAYTATEDSDLSVAAADGLLEGSSDPEGNPRSAVVVTQPSKGALVSATADGAFVYRPNRNARGVDTFTFKVNDGQLDSPVETVTITIEGVNDPPPAIDDNFSALGELVDQVLGDVLANDLAAFNPDGNEDLRIVRFDATTAQGGTVTLNGSGRLVYSPPAGFSGADSFTYTVGDGNGGQSSATVNVDVRPAQLNGLSGFVYRDLNENGRRDTGEPGIGDVTVRLVNTANGNVVGTRITNGQGRYGFGGVGAGTFRIEEVQPRYLHDGLEQNGSAGGVVGNDRITIDIPGAGLPNNAGVNYNFGEGNVKVGQNDNGDPQLEFTLEEILATNTHLGALVALQGDRREWFTTLDASWSNVVNMNVQLAADMSRLTLTIVVNQAGGNQTYRAVVLRNPSNPEALRFRVMATNNEGFQIIRLDGDLNLSEFNRIG